MDTNINYNTEKQYVVFRLDDEYFGANVNFIESIEKLSPITRVPTNKKSTLGIINLRGDVIPVVDLKGILGVKNTPAESSSRIIITDISGSKVGIIADSVVEVCEVSSGMIQDNVKVFRGKNRECIIGVAKVNGKYIMILNLEQLLWGEG